MIEAMINQIICGDCIDVMKRLPDNSIDTIITDPPYGLEFMNKDWDKLGKIGRDRSKAIKKSSFDKIMNSNYKTPRIVRSSRRKCKVCNGYSGGPFQLCSCDNPQWLPSSYPAAIQQWHYNWAVEALRIIKPGGTLLSFGGTRTFHRLACALEDAGWILKDCLMWLYGSGFPKATDISKQIDKMKGLKRKIKGYTENARPNRIGKETKLSGKQTIGGEITYPQTEEAKLWDGWKSHGLKPAYEPIIVAMKQNEGSYAENALKWGVSGFNIEESRIEFELDGTVATNPLKRKYSGKPHLGADWFPKGKGQRYNFDRNKITNNKGRFPANIILDEEAARMLDEQTGILKSGTFKNRAMAGIWSKNKLNQKVDYKPNTGGASRFFYIAKATTAERNEYCGELEARSIEIQQPHNSKTLQGRYNLKNKNPHPTLKPLKLMEYLCILTKTPTGGIVLDPFVGSGTTTLACKNTGRQFIGIDNDPEYCEIAKKRLRQEVLF